MTVSTELDRLGDEKYVLLTTFRKDGRAVSTPVWAARDGDALDVWTAPDAGKVKRIRRDGTVRVAPCDRRGKPTGEAADAHAVVLPRAETEHALDLIRAKYGLLAKILIAGGRLRRGPDTAAALRVTFG
jgi:uncharacterized protein